MREYVDIEVSKLTRMYDEYIRATGSDYSGLYKMHTTAVSNVDLASSEVAIPHMIIPSRMVAYLTDRVLQDLALGAALHLNRTLPTFLYE